MLNDLRIEIDNSVHLALLFLDDKIGDSDEQRVSLTVHPVFTGEFL
jgi:hypothetical protein